MDNLTHSMVGAVLGQMGLKRKSGLGMATMIIAANIPDIDATCTFLGTQSLAMRRGLTHGPIAMLLLIGGYLWARRGERIDGAHMRKRARIIFTIASAYIFTNGVMTGVAEAKATSWLSGQGIQPDLVVANPRPFLPWRREILWRGMGRYGAFPWSALSSAKPEASSASGEPTGLSDPGIALARARDDDARAFLFWSRMPLARREENGDLVLMDQRFADRFSSGSFIVRVPAETLK